MLGGELRGGLLVVHPERGHPDAGLGQGITGSLERTQLSGAVGAPRSAVEQQDSELAGEPAGNLDSLRAGNVEGQLGERVAGVQQGHGLPPYGCRRVNLTASIKGVPAQGREAALIGGSDSTPPRPASRHSLRAWTPVPRSESSSPPAAPRSPPIRRACRCMAG